MTPTTPTTIRIEPDLLAAVDDRADQLGLSRSALIEDILSKELKYKKPVSAEKAVVANAGPEKGQEAIARAADIAALYGLKSTGGPRQVFIADEGRRILIKSTTAAIIGVYDASLPECDEIWACFVLPDGNILVHVLDPETYAENTTLRGGDGPIASLRHGTVRRCREMASRSFKIQSGDLEAA